MSNPHTQLIPPGPPGAVSAALACLRRFHPHADAWDLEPTPDDARAQARRWLCERGMSPLWREEALALLQHVPALTQLEALDFPEDLALHLGARVDGDLWAEAVAAGWGPGTPEARRERAGLLALALEEAGVAGGSVDPWVGAEQLPEDDPEGPRIANELRWLRLEGELASPWAAWARLPAHQGPGPRPRLVWTMGLPGAARPRLSALGLHAELSLSMADVAHARGAQARRRLAVQRIADALGRGISVAWIANSTTLDSRRALISAARRARAEVVAVYFDDPPQAIEADQAAKGWELSERAYERGLAVLEGPRPHEAEEVIVARDGAVVERWRAPVRGGWRLAAP